MAPVMVLFDSCRCVASQRASQPGPYGPAPPNPPCCSSPARRLTLIAPSASTLMVPHCELREEGQGKKEMLHAALLAGPACCTASVLGALYSPDGEHVTVRLGLAQTMSQPQARIGTSAFLALASAATASPRLASAATSPDRARASQPAPSTATATWCSAPTTLAS